MEIIDLKKYSNNTLMPVCCLGDLILLREMVQVFYPSSDPGINGYYFYDIKKKNVSKVDTKKMKILIDLYHLNSVEGDDSFYFISYKKQLWVNDYSLNKIDLKTKKTEVLFEFYEDNKMDALSIEVLDDEHVLILFKKLHELTFEEFESFDLSKSEYGYEKAVLYNIVTGEQFEVKDKNFLRGYKFVFFRTELKGEKCVVYEENYIDAYNKEQIYLDIHMHRKSDKEKFFYRDCLKYSTLEQFIREVKEGREKLSFTDIESRGIKGYEIFSGTDENNIYYEVNDFGVEDGEAMVVLDRKTLNKRIIELPNQLDEESVVLDHRYTWNLEDKNKVILYQRLMKDRNIELKEVMNGNVNYTFPEDLGFANECVEGRYLITLSHMNEIETSVIDMDKKCVRSFKREHKVLGDYLILY